ncbi:hypothetical protein BJ508DRAFT_74691 [Ascobolus immersus RN42]|uniref:Uncharacterized protein n=1 Tax=Ascobolus immersus RN42 TaxID=1160509 RepID=A0A3N4IAV7_ASCIM|nr:hypothetical protein BJ508DRAFT_74691 [Ascobolus immersus RN42]
MTPTAQGWYYTYIQLHQVPTPTPHWHPLAVHLDDSTLQPRMTPTAQGWYYTYIQLHQVPTPTPHWHPLAVHLDDSTLQPRMTPTAHWYYIQLHHQFPTPTPHWHPVHLDDATLQLRIDPTFKSRSDALPEHISESIRQFISSSSIELSSLHLVRLDPTGTFKSTGTFNSTGRRDAALLEYPSQSDISSRAVQ